MHRAHRNEFTDRRTSPPPNPGGFGPFPIYRCQAPNGWLAGDLWTTEKVVHMWAKGLTTASIDVA